MVHEWIGPVTRGTMCEAHRALYVRYIRTHHYYYYYYYYYVVQKKLLFTLQVSRHCLLVSQGSIATPLHV